MSHRSRTLFAVHAHPDDESSATGGLLRLLAQQGHTTVLVTCTNGELGEVRDNLETGGPDICRACDLPRKDSPLWVGKLV